jgi:hypothetical protein
MGAIEMAGQFCGSLSAHQVRYHLDVVRDGAITVSLAVPGQRWEVEFFDDGSIELERFESLGVDGCADPLALVLAEIV